MKKLNWPKIETEMMFILFRITMSRDWTANPQRFAQSGIIAPPLQFWEITTPKNLAMIFVIKGLDQQNYSLSLFWASEKIPMHSLPT